MKHGSTILIGDKEADNGVASCKFTEEKNSKLDLVHLKLKQGGGIFALSIMLQVSFTPAQLSDDDDDDDDDDDGGGGGSSDFISTRVRIGQYLSDAFPIHCGLKQEDAQSPLLLNFALEYVIRKVQDNREGLEFNGYISFLSMRMTWNMLGENPQTIRENTEILLEASKAIGLEVNPEKTSWKTGGKTPLGRPRRRWEDNIKMDLIEVGYDDRDWINPAQDRDRWRAYVMAAMNLQVP
ncbi:hypothetical protein ANN_23751 [Periplaneta americana]|uniref:Uncharacterized protein n=1 Tax=Periplaneta americana TaxID=6978 RepID=A0ABQ8SLZ5_PERAM|nr:hypothetical protein ANN_23751 [Periplaneta americana]